MLSVRQIQDYAATQLHEDPDDTRLTTLLLRWVNEGLQDVASAENWKWLEGLRTLTYGTHGAGVNTSAGVTYLPHYVHRLISVWATGLDSRKQVQILGGWEIDALDPSMIAGSPADCLAVFGYYNVARDNPTAGLIACADAGGATFSVKVEGVDVNGFEMEEVVAIVAGGPNNTANQYAAGPDGVRRCYILENSITAGTPTIVTFTSTGTVIEQLNYTNGELIHEHLRTELSPAPDTTGSSYLTRYLKRIRPVTSVNDVVEIPFEFENLLMFAIERRLSAYQGRQEQAMAYGMEFRQRVKELQAWQNRQPGRMKMMRGVSRFSLR